MLQVQLLNLHQNHPEFELDPRGFELSQMQSSQLMNPLQTHPYLFCQESLLRLRVIFLQLLRCMEDAILLEFLNHKL